MLIFLGRPWLAGLLNFVLPGLGYLYHGNRKVFGTMLLIATFFFSLWLSFSPTIKSEFNSIWATLATLFFMFAFAVDGYYNAREHKVSQKHHGNK